MKYAIEMKVMNSLLCLLLFVLLFNSGKSQTEIDTMSFTSVLAQAKSDSARQWIILDYIEDHYRNEPDYCLSLTDTLLMLGKKNPQDNHISKALSFAGAIFKNKGEYSTALDFHFQSEQINLLKNDKKALATNYNDIGIIYKTLKEYDKALEYYLKSNSLTVEMGMKRGIVMTLNNIGTIYESKSELNDAVKYFEMAYTKSLEYNILSGQAIALSNLGEVYGLKGDNAKARLYFKQALVIDSKTEDLFGAAISNLNLAGTYVNSGDTDSALFYYDKSEKIAKELNAKQILVQLYSSKAELFQLNKDFSAALESMKLYNQYHDSLYNEKKAEELAEAEAKYEALKKDNEIRMLKNEQVISIIQQKQYQSERIAWISLVSLGIVILVYLYKRYQQKQTVLFNLKMLQQKELYLKAIVETQEEERKRIAKDLHDGIGQTLSGIKLSLVTIVTKMPEEEVKVKLQSLSQTLDTACSDVRSISHQMMPRLLQEEGLIPAIGDMLEKSFRLSSISYNFEHYGMEGRVKENIEISLYRICQELINNIIKHSGATEVSVQLFRNGKNLVLLVEDNGKGFAFQEKKSSGIGLMNISSRVETVHGEFNLEPSPQSGTLATIRIPIETQ